MGSTPFLARSSRARTFPRGCRSATKSHEFTFATRDLQAPRERRITIEQFIRVLAIDRLTELLLDHGRVGHRLRREMIVRVQVRLLDDPPRGIDGVGELLQLLCAI